MAYTKLTRWGFECEGEYFYASEVTKDSMWYEDGNLRSVCGCVIRDGDRWIFDPPEGEYQREALLQYSCIDPEKLLEFFNTNGAPE